MFVDTKRGGLVRRFLALAGLLVAFAASLDAALQDAAGAARTQDAAEPARPEEAAAVEPPFLIPRGEGELPLQVPRGEELIFRARIRLGPVDTKVGTISLASGVEPYRESLLFGGSGGGDKHTAWVRARAEGEHTFYSMDSLIESRFQPQAWPALVHTFTQKGTEQRRREILIGVKDGKSVRTYRSDTSKGAPPGTRIWRSPETAPCPLTALDSITAVYLLRSMLEASLDETHFPMIDKQRLWWVHAKVGEAEKIETHTGTFLARPVKLASTKIDPKNYEADIAALGKPDAPDPEFEGPFGIRGDIRLWVEATSGVPIWIEGDLPLGFLTLGLDIRLERYRGTPASFRPVEAP